MLERDELLKIEGGASFGLVGGIIAGVTFIIGVLNGYLSPTKCKK